MYALVAFAQEEKKATNLPISQTNNPFPSSQSPASAAKCVELIKLSLPDVTITSATSTPAGRFTPPGSSNVLETPAFCRVAAVAKPTSDSIIKFEVWIRYKRILGKDDPFSHSTNQIGAPNATSGEPFHLSSRPNRTDDAAA
jgi:hypothetical protein